MNEEEKSLVEQLRKVNQNLSYEKIAKALDCSPQSVYRWLKGKAVPSQLALKAIAEFVATAK